MCIPSRYNGDIAHLISTLNCLLKYTQVGKSFIDLQATQQWLTDCKL